MLYEDFDSITRTLGAGYFKGRVPEYIANSLSSVQALRGYQKEALGRLVFYLGEYQAKQVPVHLLFNMATGSGKTLIMAGAMVHLYKLGYRNFIFFVNSTNIIEKTKDNFLNGASSKYLFAEKIAINGKDVAIRAVNNFSASSKDEINILFTTIQGLHRRMTEPRENVLTEDDFTERDVVFLSDEAHHINALTRAAAKLNADEKEEKLTWEGTIDKILHKNARNVMLEFTATVDMDDSEIARKYSDKLIYRYDLAQFRADGFSKDIFVAGVNFEPMERALGAVVLSQFRLKVAGRHGIPLRKPVILMKSRTIAESQAFEQAFHKKIRALRAVDITKLKPRASDAEQKSMTHAFAFFEQEGIELSDLAREIKDDFSEERCVSVNSKDDSEEKQLLVNSLEDKTNPIRVVFAVDKLNEGWDVLNLFDIVRLYDTRDARSNVPGKTTMAEAQLIGRGARYWPFSQREDRSDMYTRKFDEDLENDLRILEQLHYHTKFDNRYIDEIKKALQKTGALPPPENVHEYKIKVKDSIKKSRFWKEGQIFTNERRNTGRRHIKKLKDVPSMPSEFVHSVSHGGGGEISAFEGPAFTIREIVTRPIKIDAAVWRAGIYRLPFYQFNSLVTFFPNVESINGFIESVDYLGGIKISAQGAQADIDTITRDEELACAMSALEKIALVVQANATEYEGTKQFSPAPMREVVRDKTIRVVVPDGGVQERGIPMRAARTSGLALDLSNKDWYVYDENYGTEEEKRLVHFIHSAMSDLEKRYDEVYLLRNERLFSLYRFSDGEAIEPDFVLFLREVKGKDAIVYHLFIEPKGPQLVLVDKWKEDFLKEIETTEESKTLFENDEYRIVGLPFYTHTNKEKFEEAFELYSQR